MDLFQAMRVFSAAAAEGSMTAGGKRLGLSKALVSRTIADLESHLNVRLLNRTTRRIGLTEAGAAYLEHCREILERNEEAECRLAEVSQQVTGTLRVNAPINYGSRTLAPLIPAFLARHPDVRIEMELTDRFVDLVEEGVDLLIRIGIALPETAIARKIGKTSLHLIAAPSLIAERGTPKTLADLAGWPRIVYPPKPGPETLPSRQTGPEIVRSNNGEVLVAMVEAGLGYGYLPEFLVTDALTAGRVATILDTEMTETLPIHALWPHRKHLSFKTRAFVDYLVETLR